MSVLHTHAAIRIHPPEQPARADRWRATNLMTRVSYRLPRVACAVLIAFGAGRNRAAGVREVAAATGASIDVVERIVEDLRGRGLLVSPDDADHCFARELMTRWTRYGWTEAADYHLATFDYPFLDYATREAGMEDVRRMREYGLEQYDGDRFKRYPDPIARHSAPAPRDVLRRMEAPFGALWENVPPLRPLDAESVTELMAVVFGRLRGRTPRYNRDLRAEMVRKISPSGGSRHPTEGYLLARDVPSLAPGVYHFCAGDNTLDQIGCEVPDDRLSMLFMGHTRVGFRPRAFAVMTTVFGRNMYRYREPRTFRTVFMDVGHVASSMEISARSLGLLCASHDGMDEPELDALFGNDPLLEGTVLWAALGGHGDDQ